MWRFSNTCLKLPWKISHALRQTTQQALTPAIYSSLNPVGATNNRNKALFLNCLWQCGLLSAEAFALTTGAVFAKRARATPRSPQGSTLSDTTRGFSLPAHCLHHHSSFPPSFPSVRNLYFISELWSSSAQLSADKAQEALERRHGYLDGEGGEGAGERKAGRQAGRQGPNPPGALRPHHAIFFFLLVFFLFSPLLTASSSPPPFTLAAGFN